MEKVLPELLEIMFSFLRPKDIENAADVCQGWREIIVSSTPLMKRLTLSVKFRNKLEENFYKLPYRNIDLDCSFSYSLDRVQSNVRQFLQTVDRGQVEKLHIYLRLGQLPITEFLTGMNNLTTLVVEQLPEHNSGDVKLPNLTHLKLMDSGLVLLSKIKSHKVKFLHLSSSKRLWEWQWAQYSYGFKDFLLICGELKHLIIHGIPSLTLEHNIQLESLEIIGLPVLQNNFKHFLESQQASLKYLQIDVDEIDNEFSNFIYHEMNLEKLIDSSMKRRKITEMKDVKIKNLTLNLVQNDFAFIQGLLPYCNDLEVLNINLLKGMELELLRVISQLPKLKHLKLRGWPDYARDRIGANLQFPQLEELIIPDYRIVFIASNWPKLKRLEIVDESWRGLTLSAIDFERIFKNCPDIEKIDVGVIHRFTEEMLEALKFAGSKIKLKCRVFNEHDYENLVQLKNRLIVNLVDINPCEDDTDLFSFEPKTLTELYGDIDECMSMNERNSTGSLSWKNY